MPDFRIYLRADELAYVHRHDKGFVRGLVKWSMAKEKQQRQQQAACPPIREERRERFEEVP